MQEMCLCGRKPERMLEIMAEMGEEAPANTNPETGFFPACGKCHDPCALKWRKDGDDEDEEDDEMGGERGNLYKKLERKPVTPNN